MTNDDESTTGFSLRRWSRRKLEAARAGPAAAAPAEAAEAVARAPVVPEAPVPAAATAPADPGAAVAPDALPPVETLGFDADFTAYLQPKVDEQLKRRALKRMFQDPHFNVMDGLDTYIGDYSIEDPIPPEMLARLLENRYLFDPPKTRINAQGYVEDVPPDEEAATAAEGRDEAAAPGATGESAQALPEPAASSPADRLPAETAEPMPAIRAESATRGEAPIARPHDKETPAR